MRLLFITLLPLLFALTAHGQSGPYMFSGTGFLGNGQIGILAENAEAGIVLPALLANREKGGWAVAAATRGGLKDLTEVAGTAHLVLPWDDQVALGLQYTGIDGYAEQRITFSYARRLFDKLSAGLQFDFNINDAREYDNIMVATWSISVYAPVMKELSFSAWLYNPLGVESALNLPSMIRLGLLYSPSEKLDLAVEAEKDWAEKLRIKIGMNYHLHERLAVRWGIGTQPSLIHAGISWAILNNMALSGGWRYHSRLGSTLSASVSQYEYK